MTAFDIRDGRLHAEEVALDALARDLGTPFYCYSTRALEDAYDAFARAVESRTSFGGTAPTLVRAAVAAARERFL